MKAIDLSKNPNQEYEIYRNGSDFIKAKFKYSKKNISQIELTSSSMKKEIELVNYCKDTDALEVHYYRNSPNPFKPVTYNLSNCKLDCLRFLLLEYDKGDTITPCSSSNEEIINPDTIKGNIIVGNP